MRKSCEQALVERRDEERGDFQGRHRRGVFSAREHDFRVRVWEPSVGEEAFHDVVLGGLVEKLEVGFTVEVALLDADTAVGVAEMRVVDLLDATPDGVTGEHHGA